MSSQSSSSAPANAATSRADELDTRICMSSFEASIEWILRHTQQCFLARGVNEHAEGFDTLLAKIESWVDPSVRGIEPPYPDHNLPKDGNVDDVQTRAMLAFYAARWRIYIEKFGPMSIETVKARILSNPSHVFGTKDGNNRHLAFRLLLDKFSADSEKCTKFRESMLSCQLFMPAVPYVMQALAASANGTTRAFVKTSDFTTFLQSASFISGFKISLTSECNGDFVRWVMTTLLQSTTWLPRLGCYNFLRRTSDYLSAQLKKHERSQVVLRDVMKTYVDNAPVLLVGERAVFATFVDTPALTLTTLLTLRELTMSMLHRLSNLPSRAIHLQVHSKKFLLPAAIKNALVCFGAPNVDESKDKWAGTGMESQQTIAALRPLFSILRDNEALENDDARCPTISTMQASIVFKHLARLVLQQSLTDGVSSALMANVIDQSMALLDPLAGIWNNFASGNGPLLPLAPSGAQFMPRWTRYFGSVHGSMSVLSATAAYASPPLDFFTSKVQFWDAHDTRTRALPMCVGSAVSSLLVHNLHAQLSAYGAVGIEIFELVNFAISFTSLFDISLLVTTKAIAEESTAADATGRTAFTLLTSKCRSLQLIVEICGLVVQKGIDLDCVPTALSSSSSTVVVSSEHQQLSDLRLKLWDALGASGADGSNSRSDGQPAAPPPPLSLPPPRTASGVSAASLTPSVHPHASASTSTPAVGSASGPRPRSPFVSPNELSPNQSQVFCLGGAPISRSSSSSSSSSSDGGSTAVGASALMMLAQYPHPSGVGAPVNLLHPPHGLALELFASQLPPNLSLPRLPLPASLAASTAAASLFDASFLPGAPSIAASAAAAEAPSSSSSSSSSASASALASASAPALVAAASASLSAPTAPLAATPSKRKHGDSDSDDTEDDSIERRPAPRGVPAKARAVSGQGQVAAPASKQPQAPRGKIATAGAAPGNGKGAAPRKPNGTFAKGKRATSVQKKAMKQAQQNRQTAGGSRSSGAPAQVGKKAVGSTATGVSDASASSSSSSSTDAHMHKMAARLQELRAALLLSQYSQVSLAQDKHAKVLAVIQKFESSQKRLDAAASPWYFSSDALWADVLDKIACIFEQNQTDDDPDSLDDAVNDEVKTITTLGFILGDKLMITLLEEFFERAKELVRAAQAASASIASTGSSASASASSASASATSAAKVPRVPRVKSASSSSSSSSSSKASRRSIIATEVKKIVECDAFVQYAVEAVELGRELSRATAAQNRQFGVASAEEFEAKYENNDVAFLIDLREGAVKKENKARAQSPHKDGGDGLFTLLCIFKSSIVLFAAGTYFFLRLHDGSVLSSAAEIDEYLLRERAWEEDAADRAEFLRLAATYKDAIGKIADTAVLPLEDVVANCFSPFAKGGLEVLEGTLGSMNITHFGAASSEETARKTGALPGHVRWTRECSERVVVFFAWRLRRPYPGQCPLLNEAGVQLNNIVTSQLIGNMRLFLLRVLEMYMRGDNVFGHLARLDEWTRKQAETAVKKLALVFTSREPAVKLDLAFVVQHGTDAANKLVPYLHRLARDEKETSQIAKALQQIGSGSNKRKRDFAEYSRRLFYLEPSEQSCATIAVICTYQSLADWFLPRLCKSARRSRAFRCPSAVITLDDATSDNMCGDSATLRPNDDMPAPAANDDLDPYVQDHPLGYLTVEVDEREQSKGVTMLPEMYEASYLLPCLVEENNDRSIDSLWPAMLEHDMMHPVQSLYLVNTSETLQCSESTAMPGGTRKVPHARMNTWHCRQSVTSTVIVMAPLEEYEHDSSSSSSSSSASDAHFITDLFMQQYAGEPTLLESLVRCSACQDALNVGIDKLLELDALLWVEDASDLRARLEARADELSAKIATAPVFERARLSVLKLRAERNVLMCRAAELLRRDAISSQEDTELKELMESIKMTDKAIASMPFSRAIRLTTIEYPPILNLYLNRGKQVVTGSSIRASRNRTRVSVRQQFTVPGVGTYRFRSAIYAPSGHWFSRVCDVKNGTYFKMDLASANPACVKETWETLAAAGNLIAAVYALEPPPQATLAAPSALPQRAPASRSSDQSESPPSQPPPPTTASSSSAEATDATDASGILPSSSSSTSSSSSSSSSSSARVDVLADLPAGDGVALVTPPPPNISSASSPRWDGAKRHRVCGVCVIKETNATTMQQCAQCDDWLHTACGELQKIDRRNLCARCVTGLRARDASAIVTARHVDTIRSSIRAIDVNAPLLVVNTSLPPGDYFTLPQQVASDETRRHARQALVEALEKNRAVHVPSMQYDAAAPALADAVSAHHHLEHVPLLSAADSAVLAEQRRHASNGDYLVASVVFNGHGFSVQALVDIAPRTLIAEYTGFPKPWSDAVHSESQHQFELVRTGVATHSVMLCAERAASLGAFVDGAVKRANSNSQMLVANDGGKLRLELVATDLIRAGQLIVYPYGKHFEKFAGSFVDRCPSDDTTNVQSFLGHADSLRFFGPPASRWHLTPKQLSKRPADEITAGELREIALAIPTTLKRLEYDGAIGAGCQTLVNIAQGAKFAFLSGEWSDVRTDGDEHGVYEMKQTFPELDVTRYLNVKSHLAINAFNLANHDCQRANARIECHVVGTLVVFFAFAKRAIKAGEPIYFDYRGGDANAGLPFTCLCPSCLQLAANLVELLERPFTLRTPYEFFPLLKAPSKVATGQSGLFARSAIPKGTPIAEYVGKVLRTGAEITAHEKAQPDGMCYLVQFMFHGKKYAIDFDPTDASHGKVGFANHSLLQPNTELRVVETQKRQRGGAVPRLMLFATEDVAADDELLFDYREQRAAVVRAFKFLRDASAPQPANVAAADKAGAGASGAVAAATRKRNDQK